MDKIDLYSPVHFDPPPKTPTQPDDGFVPSFCRAAETTSDYVAVPLPAAATAPLCPPMAFVPEFAPVPGIKTPPEMVRRKPTAYAISRDLLSKVTLILVNECLYLYNGRVYRPVTAEVMKRVIMACCRSDIQASGSPRMIEDVYKFLQTEPLLVRKDLQEDSQYVAFRNGLLNLDTLQMEPFNPERFVTYQIETDYIPDCSGYAPAFDTFLSVSCGDDPLLAQRLLEAIGYTLVPDSSGKVFFLAQGVPNSGKSVLGELLASFFDEDLVTATDFNTLGRQFGVGDLLGKRLSLSMDLPGGRWDSRAVGQLKSMTGNDLFSADIKYLPRIKFRNTATFWFGTNHPVVLAGRDPAFLQRLVVLPFRYSVPPEKQDHFLLDRLKQEKDAIAFRAIHAYLQLRRNHYRFAGDFHLNEVVAGSSNDSESTLERAIADFFASHCDIEAGVITFLSDLYTQFNRCYPGLLSPGTFSNQFFGYVLSLFPGKIRKVRKRGQNGGNPLSAFEGLRLLGPGGERDG
jgi:Predicted ATPase